jgi:hypothetical protein
VIDPKVERLVRFIVEHSERESRLLTPDPAWFIGAHGVLREIASVFEISEADMTALVDGIADELETKARKP